MNLLGPTDTGSTFTSNNKYYWNIRFTPAVHFTLLFLLLASQCAGRTGTALDLLKGSLVPDTVTVCYISSWAVYRPDDGKFTVDDINPQLCTHIIYAFAGLNSSFSTIRSLDPFNDLEDNYGKGTYKKITALKSRYPHLKVTIAIGGWNEGSENYSKMASSPSTRRTFVESVVQFIRDYGFDGLDLDWEYPGRRGGAPQDKQNFVQLVQDLRREMDNNGWILTAALGAAKETIDTAYDLAALSEGLDYIHLMCYDYHGAWDGQVGPNAPLTSNKPDDPLTIEYSIKYLLANGVNPKKLILGLPFYGRTFKLSNADKEDNRTSESNGFQGPYTRENGFMGYNEICQELTVNMSSWTEWWDEESKTMYARNGEKVISYDNERSLKEKVKLAMEQGLGGVMVWTIDTDDFRGKCKGSYGKYPLLNSLGIAIRQALEDIKNNKKKEPNSATQNNTVHKHNTIIIIAIVQLTFISLFTPLFFLS